MEPDPLRDDARPEAASPSALTHRLHSYAAVTLGNRELSVTVLPERGGEIHALVLRRRGLDLLWKPPWGLPPPRPHVAAGPESEAAWMENYGGGWQGIFPNGGDSCLYRGAHLGFHGEASTLPWQFSIHRAADTVTLRQEVRLLRSPFRCVREITLDRDTPSLYIAETVRNESAENLHVMWGQHPAFSAEFLADAVIETSAATYESHAPELDSSSRTAEGRKHAWPLTIGKAGEPVDLSRLPSLDQRLSEFGYLAGLEEGRYVIRNARLGLAVECRWDLETFPFLWFWLEWGAGRDWPWYGQCRVGALEPFSSIPGVGLHRAIERGTVTLLRGGESRGTALTLRVLETAAADRDA